MPLAYLKEKKLKDLAEDVWEIGKGGGKVKNR